jgi:hypothetical protein
MGLFNGMEAAREKQHRWEMHTLCTRAYLRCGAFKVPNERHNGVAPLAMQRRRRTVLLDDKAEMIP